jgi:hypothetical protein
MAESVIAETMCGPDADAYLNLRYASGYRVAL